MSANFTGDKRRLLELAGLSQADMDKILTEDKCDKCEADPCKCSKEEQEEGKVCGKCKKAP